MLYKIILTHIILGIVHLIFCVELVSQSWSWSSKSATTGTTANKEPTKALQLNNLRKPKIESLQQQDTARDFQVGLGPLGLWGLAPKVSQKATRIAMFSDCQLHGAQNPLSFHSTCWSIGIPSRMMIIPHDPQYIGYWIVNSTTPTWTVNTIQFDPFSTTHTNWPGFRKSQWAPLCACHCSPDCQQKAPQWVSHRHQPPDHGSKLVHCFHDQFTRWMLHGAPASRSCRLQPLWLEHLRPPELERLPEEINRSFPRGILHPKKCQDYVYRVYVIINI